ncbi:GNAT family N-acetyltransferase [Iodobacter sp.]|uniref:GNAT family N-acetyltransferase n=1 Tax=Iodobacter sp. TaxID=1915058 RepID=UPI0025FBC44B|nr:GNAT family N-acetyltransferase [Iodobacter sp.]
MPIDRQSPNADLKNHSFAFWQSALGLTNAEMLCSQHVISHLGHYLSKSDEQSIFHFTHLANGKQVLALPEKIRPLLASIDLNENRTLIDAAILAAGFVEQYRDIDYHLEQINSLKRINNSIQHLNSNSPLFKGLLPDFLRQQTAEDRDILDLEEDDEAIALVADGAIQAIARYVPLKLSPLIADITVLVSPLARQGQLATMVVSRLCELILSRGLIPRYRVAHHHSASIKVAEKLGFTPQFTITAWRIKAGDSPSNINA